MLWQSIERQESCGRESSLHSTRGLHHRIALRSGARPLDIAARLDSGDVDASADTGVGVCEGRTYCWTFDEPDASVPSTELTLEPGGVGGSKCLRITVTDDAGVYCARELTAPVPWTEVGFDVIWSDGGATVDVAAGALTNHCTGRFKTPENVRVRPGISGIYGGASPPSRQMRLDNFIVDIE